MFRSSSLILFLVVPLYAQVYEELKVVLRDTRFHVIDRDGFPVKGLTEQDFDFFIGKRPLELTTFEEVDLLETRGTGVGPQSEDEAQAPKRNIVILIDSSNMDRRTFDQLIPSVEALIERETGPGTLIKLVQLEQYLTHLTPFTDQSDTLVDALRDLEYEGWFRQRLALLERQVALDYEEFRGSVEAGSADRELNAFNVLSSIDDKERAKLAHYTTFHANALVLGRILAPMPGDRSILYFTGGLFLENRGKLRNTYGQVNELSRILNHFGVTIFSFLHNSPTPIGAGDWQTTSVGHVEPYTAMRELFSYSPFRNELDAAGLGTNNGLMENTVQPESGPREAAALTGGFFRTTSKWESLPFEVEDFFDATQHYYRITYTVEQERENKKLKIELKNSDLDYNLRYGKRFKALDDKDKSDAESQLLNFEQTILYRDVFRNDLDCTYGFGEFTSADGAFVVPVHMAVAIEEPVEKGLATGFALFDADRELLDVVHDRVLLGDTAKRPIFYHVLLADRRPAYVRFFLQNMDDGQLSFQEFPVEFSMPTDDRPHISGLTVGETRDAELIMLHRYEASGGAEKKRPQRLAEDPFFGGELVMVPPTSNEFDSGAMVSIFFQFNHAQLPLADHEIRFALVRDKGSRDIPGQLIGADPVSKRSFRLKGVVQFKDAAPGNYDLVVGLRPKSGETIQAQVPITIR